MYCLHNNQQTLWDQSPVSIAIFDVCHVMSCHVLLQEKKEMERQLLEACKTGDLPNVKKLCRVVDASKVRDASGPCSSPLHWAARYVKHGTTIWCIMITYSTGRYLNSIMF